MQILGIALTDTFGTPTFLEAFKRPIPNFTVAAEGGAATAASTASSTTTPGTQSLSDIKAPLGAPMHNGETNDKAQTTYAQAFAGVRQDSGDPAAFVNMMRKFYDSVGIKDKKAIVFSDSLNIELCVEYKVIAEEHGFQPTFGVGTFLTSKCSQHARCVFLLTLRPRRFCESFQWRKVGSIEYRDQAILRRRATSHQDQRQHWEEHRGQSNCSRGEAEAGLRRERLGWR